MKRDFHLEVPLLLLVVIFSRHQRAQDGNPFDGRLNGHILSASVKKAAVHRNGSFCHSEASSSAALSGEK